jgi:hypothetical protein
MLFLLLVGSEKPCICGFPNLYGPYVGKRKTNIAEYEILILENE